MNADGASGAGVIAGTAASSPPFFALFLPFLAAADDMEASDAFADGFLCLLCAVDSVAAVVLVVMAAVLFVVVVAVFAVIIAVVTASVIGCFCLFQ